MLFGSGCRVVPGLRVLDPGWRGVAVPWLCCCGLWVGWTIGSWTVGGFVLFYCGVWLRHYFLASCVLLGWD